MTKGWPYEQGILQSPEVLLPAFVLRLSQHRYDISWQVEAKPGQCWESVSRVAAKKRTSDSKKLIRLSYSAADRQQLNSHFFVVCVSFFIFSCPGVWHIWFLMVFIFHSLPLYYGTQFKQKKVQIILQRMQEIKTNSRLVWHTLLVLCHLFVVTSFSG